MGPEDFNALLEALREDGYATVDGYLDGPRLALLQEEARRLLSDSPFRDERHPDGWREVVRVSETSEAFKDLHFDPLLAALGVALLGPDVEFASAGELDEKFPGSETNGCGWHSDFTWMAFVPRPRPFFWLAAYYFLSDIAPESGPLHLLPGSHAWIEEPGPHLDNEAGHGLPLTGSVEVTGRAGTLLLVNNECWHMSPPNTGASSRIIYKVHVKPGWMKPWGGARSHTTEFAESLKLAHQRQLVGLAGYDDVPWEYGDDADVGHYPVVAWLAQSAPWASGGIPTR